MRHTIRINLKGGRPPGGPVLECQTRPVSTWLWKSVYCAFTICLVDKDFAYEMETAVVEISQDEGPYILPVFISEEALDYFNYDDIAKLSYWLGNFWVGIQYEMNNRPEEIRVIEQRGSISGNSEEYKKGNHIVLVRRIVPVDEDGNIIKYLNFRDYCSTVPAM